MRIINILEIINGIPNKIESFPIYEDQLSQEIVHKAEKFFLQLIEENRKPLLNEDLDLEDIEETEEFYLDEGVYDNKNGYELYIIWSEIN